MKTRLPALNPLLLAVVALSLLGVIGVPVLGQAVATVPELQATPLPTLEASSPTPEPSSDRSSLALASPPAQLSPSAVALAVSPAAIGEPTPTPAPTATAASGLVAASLPLSLPASSPVPAAQPTATPPPKRIGLQAGHWKAAEQSDELAFLRGSTGAEGKGWAERDVNLDIARRVATMLLGHGFVVDLLPAAVPVHYQADVFLALHGDANSNSAARGFKVARSSRSAIPKLDDALVEAINRGYGRLTAIPRNDQTITNNMRFYYAFPGGSIQHAIAATTPGAILEMGFLTNATDRKLLLESPDLIAQAVASSLVDFLQSTVTVK